MEPRSNNTTHKTYFACARLQIRATTTLHATALAVAYSTDESNPAGGPVTYAPADAAAMYWEAIRIFPPVVVFPYWSPRPTCVGLTPAQTAALAAPHGATRACPLGPLDARTGFPQVNQYADGVRMLPNIAMAMRDPTVWGDDAHVFRPREVALYANASVSFAEPAVDENVAGGGMNRACPGRSMALVMGTTFLRLFEKDSWFVDPKKSIRIKTGGPYVQDFTLYAKSSTHGCRMLTCGCHAEDDAEAAWPWETWSCNRCVKSKCAQ